jgi:hypothetical protein
VEWILSRDLRGVSPRPSQVQETANILLQAHDPSGFKPVGKYWVSTFINRREEIKLDMLDDIIIVELNTRIQRVSRGGLTGYDISKYNMTSPMKISTTLMKQASRWA